jgi:hypothetical protein
MVRKRRLGTSSLGVKYQGLNLLCMNWVGMRYAEKAVNGLDQWLGPTLRKCGRERSPGCATRLWSLLEGHTSTECKRMWHVTPCSGKKLWMRQERCSQGTNTLCWLSGIVFRIKSTFWRNVYENLHCLMTLGSKAVVSASNTLYSIWTCWVTLVTHPTPS